MLIDPHSASPDPVLGKSPAERRRTAVLEVALIFAIFFIHGAWPVPEVNETHYLAKAKHYWNPDWCARDFFLNTADAHQVFYWLCGWITRFLSLPASAWVGRVVTWALLAWSWRRLSVAVVPEFFCSVLSAGLFVAGVSQLHMAGEWIIGGFEAKGLAYVFVLLALEAVVRDRWRAVWPLLGAASAFHVVIGAWAVVMAGAAWLAAGRRRPTIRAMLGPLAFGFLLSLPGLLPALALARGVEPWTAHEAARIYVFERLPHHLVPQTFRPDFIRRQLLLWALWLILTVLAPNKRAERRLRWVVAASIGLAIVGFAFGAWGFSSNATAAGILRYYWFRMSDIFVPLGMALAAIDCLVALRARAPVRANAWLAVALLLAGYHLTDVVIRRVRQPLAPADAAMADPVAWREICDWAAEHTPPEALFIVPRGAQSFRWHAGRAEVVCRKDIPQDAAGIVEWWRRMNDLYAKRRDGMHSWNRSLADKGSVHLRELGERYKADYLLTEAQPPLALELASPPNRTYAVYRLPR